VNKEEQDQYLTEVARQKREEQDRLRREEFDRKYNPSDMDCERMPFGCWAIIGIAAFFFAPAIFGLLMKLFRIL
jgi:hypothetical protein